MSQERNQDLAGEVKRNIGLLGFACRVLAGVIELPSRNPRSIGHRYCTWSFPSIFLPLVYGAILARPDEYGRVVIAQECGWAFLGLGGLWFVHRFVSSFARGKRHSRHMGCTWFCRRESLVLESLAGFGLAFWLAYHSEPLCSLMLHSTFANIVYVSMVRMRYRLEDDSMSDQYFTGLEAVERLRRQGR